MMFKMMLATLCAAMGGMAGAHAAEAGGSAGQGPVLVAAASPARGTAADPRSAAPAGSFIATSPARVNTSTEGQQVLRSLGALDDGGYAVAWLSGTSSLYLQRYDARGQRVGGETLLPIDFSGANAANVLDGSSLAVLRNGDVVVSYGLDTTIPATRDSGTRLKQGVFMQRFDIHGRLIVGETAVFARELVPNYRTPSLTHVRTTALADGGFAVGWMEMRSSSVTIRSTAFVQRFGSDGQPVGGTEVVGDPQAQAGNSFSIVADAQGGFVVTVSGPNENYTGMAVSVRHFGLTGGLSLAPDSPGALLLPLESGGYLLFATDAAGRAFRQRIDSIGQPGERQPFAALPMAARELPSGGSLLFWWNAFGIDGLSAQRFDAAGQPTGRVFALATQGATPVIAVLEEDGFVLAASVASGPGDLDVYAQRFIEVPERAQLVRKAKRAACKEIAKRLKGAERQRLMDSCLAA